MVHWPKSVAGYVLALMRAVIVVGESCSWQSCCRAICWCWRSSSSSPLRLAPSSSGIARPRPRTTSP
jgi:hypothetical protein